MDPVGPAEASAIQYNCHLGAETLCDRLITLWGDDDDLCVHKESGNVQGQLCPDEPTRAFLGARVTADDLLDLIFPLITAQ